MSGWRLAARSLLPLLALLLLGAASARAQVDFRGVGDLPGGDFESRIYGISADGRVAVGASETAVETDFGELRVGDEPVRWDAATGIEGLGFLGPPIPLGFNESRDASADGSVIVGIGNFDAFRWTEASGITGIVSGGPGFARANATSADATVAAGFTDLGVSTSPFVWTEEETLFPRVDGEFTVGSFEDLSADGSVAVGSAAPLESPSRPAVRWTAAEGFQPLGTLPGGSDSGSAAAVSADGSVVFGSTGSARGTEAFRWTQADPQLISLGDLSPGDELASAALDTTADGLVAVGRSSAGAFIWDEARGMRELARVLADDFGLDLDGWMLEEATGISADGRVIVGNGTNPSGQPEGWVATIPEPSTALLLTGGLLLLGGAGRRRGRLAIHAALLACALAGLDPAVAHAVPSFQGIGDLPGGSVASAAHGVSADGRVVVGSSMTEIEDREGMLLPSNEPVRWDGTTGIQGLGFGGPARFFAGPRNEAIAASADGSVIVGTTGGAFAFRWTEPTGLVITVSSPGSAVAFGVSADGSIDVGGADRGVFLSPFVRFQGDPSVVEFPEVDDAFTIGAFKDPTPDASILAGTATREAATGFRRPIRWTEAGGFEFLGALAGGTDFGEANAISADGTVLFGFASSSRGEEAFRWTEASGLVSLGDLTPGDVFASSVLDARADGLVAVGRSSAGAFLWDERRGLRELAQVLADDFGLDLDGWLLEEATGISADGRVIVGNGTNPSGQPEGWVATIPEPSTALLLAGGLLLLGGRRRRASSGGLALRGALLAWAFSGLAVGPAAAVPSFQGIGDLPGGAVDSAAFGVSADGRVVVGRSQTAVEDPRGVLREGNESVRWDRTTGIQGLGFEGLSYPVDGGLNVARAATPDGAVIVGGGNFGPFRWTEETGSQPTVTGAGPSLGLAISADGTVEAGNVDRGVSRSPYIRRTPEGGPVETLFPLIDGEFTLGAFNDLSQDGSVAVGSAAPERIFFGSAVRWTEAEGYQLLGSLPGGTDRGSANAISYDGSVIFGSTFSERGIEAVRWTEADGPLSLGDLTSSDEFSSSAYDTTADGRVAVGASSAGAFIWDEARGMRELAEVLAEDFGLDLDGWILSSAQGISADGRVIVGNGTNPSGQPEGWVASIPEPSTALLLASGLFLLGGRRRRTGSGRLVVCAGLLGGGFSGLAVGPVQAAVVFQGIGDLPGGRLESAAEGVSPDGRVVVGSSHTAAADNQGMLREGQGPIRWDAASGIQGLGWAGQPFPITASSSDNRALAASADGSVIVGASNGSAFRWTEETGIDSTVFSVGIALNFAVSSDGSVEAGGTDLGVFLSPFLATRPAGEPELFFPEIDQEFTLGAFFDLSADASVAVGTAGTLTEVRGPVRWTEAGGFEPLGSLPGGSSFGEANASSSDGSVIYGLASVEQGREAFRWTRADGMVGLGDLGASGELASEVLDTTADGRVAVGRSSAGAFVWDEVRGMRELAQVLADDFGLDLDGWLLEEATGISADGRVIVGNGTNPSGQPEGWVATIPEPSTALLLAAGLLTLPALPRSRR